MNKTTIVDIANALGITPSTVSRALSGNSKIKDSTRKAVQEKAKEMGYVRDSVASGFRKGVTRTVGIIVPRINREFFSGIISAAESVLVDHGYSVVICQSGEKEMNEQRAIKTLIAGRVAGIMISHSAETTSGDEILKALKDSNIKLVQFDRVFPELPGSKVENDDFHGAYTAVKHLLANGYRKIGALIGYNNCLSFVNRYKGYAAALEDAGIEVDPFVVFPRTILRENGNTNASKAIDAGCDAIYSSGDFSALGALECALDRGLRVPEDFGIVGTANENFTALVTPSLSSIDQHSSEIGTKAAQAMLRLLNGETDGETVIVNTDLVARKSSSGKTN